MTKKSLRAIVARTILAGIVMTSGLILNAQQTINGINYQVISMNPNRVEVIYKSGGYSGNIIVPGSVVLNDQTYIVTGIGNGAFSGCAGLMGITLLNTITSIGDGAFANCSELQSITIPEAVTYIGVGIFAECNKLTNITVQGTNPSYSAQNGVLFDKTQSTLIQYPTGKAGAYIIPSSVSNIASRAFARSSRLTSITIPSTVTRIEDDAFANCNVLVTVNFNAMNCTYMGKSNHFVFAGCNILEIVNIGGNVQTIPDYAFAGCSGLQTITIPNSVTSIGDYAFDRTNLSSLYVNAVNPPWMYANSFSFYSNSIPVYVPCGTVGLYESTLFWEDFTNIQENTPKYNITLLSNNDFKGTAVITQPNSCGHNMVIITATAYQGYSFVQWSDGNTQNPRTFFISQDTSFKALFATVYHVGTSANNATMGYVTGGGDFVENTTTSIYATANNGYRFIQWDDGNTQNPRMVMVTQHTNYTALFAPVYHVSVSANSTTMGTVSGGGDFVENTTTSIQASANNGYRFVQWNDGNTQNPRTIMVTQHLNYTAQFEGTTTNNNGTTGIADAKSTSMVVYPNPAKDNVHITLPKNISQASFALYDLQGKVVIKKNINNQDIVQVGNLAPGIYIYDVVAGKERYTGKIIRK